MASRIQRTSKPLFLGVLVLSTSVLWVKCHEHEYTDKERFFYMLIQLTQGFCAEIDDSDFSIVRPYKWFVKTPDKSNNGKSNYALTKIKQKSMLMHRLIMGAANGEQVDHIDGNGLNNRRSNLRICTNSQNQMNCPRRTTNKAGHKGVYLDYKKYYAAVYKDGRCVFRKSFDTAIEAARAYDEKARELFGEFARCNFPEE